MRARGRDWVPWFEGAMALYVTGCVTVCLVERSLLGLPFLGLFVAGYLYVLLLGVTGLGQKDAVGRNLPGTVLPRAELPPS